MAKTCAIPVLHRDKFLTKVITPVRMLRQVTPTKHTAGPLGGIARAAVTESIFTSLL